MWRTAPASLEQSGVRRRVTRRARNHTDTQRATHKPPGGPPPRSPPPGWRPAPQSAGRRRCPPVLGRCQRLQPPPAAAATRPRRRRLDQHPRQGQTGRRLWPRQQPEGGGARYSVALQGRVSSPPVCVAPHLCTEWLAFGGVGDAEGELAQAEGDLAGADGCCVRSHTTQRSLRTGAGCAHCPTPGQATHLG